MEQAKSKFEFPVLAQVAAGFAISACVLIGIGGTIYKLISPDGWFVQAFGHSMGLGAALMAALLGAAAVVYGFAAAGLLYFGQLVVYGGF